MDLKVMPKLQKGHWYILCVINEMTNYLITAPLYQARQEEVGEALIENVISKFGMPEYMIILVFSYICLQHIPYTKFRELFSI